MMRFQPLWGRWWEREKAPAPLEPGARDGYKLRRVRLESLLRELLDARANPTIHLAGVDPATIDIRIQHTQRELRTLSEQIAAL